MFALRTKPETMTCILLTNGHARVRGGRMQRLSSFLPECEVVQAVNHALAAIYVRAATVRPAHMLTAPSA
jgi:hypothetical protein